MEITIYWKTKNLSAINAIRERFHIINGMTVNGENTMEISDTQLIELKEYEKMGYIELRNKDK